jgi:CheB methylesterase
VAAERRCSTEPRSAKASLFKPLDQHPEQGTEHDLIVIGASARATRACWRESSLAPAAAVAVEVLFRTAAQARDSRLVGVILSGTRDDGAARLVVIKAEGGATVVQSPDDAIFPGMPRARWPVRWWTRSCHPPKSARLLPRS